MKKNVYPLNQWYHGRISYAIIPGTLIFVLASLLCSAQVRLVADLLEDSNFEFYPEDFRHHTRVGSMSFFVITDSLLWKSDGTQTGTVHVANAQYMSNLCALGETLFFSAFTEGQGFELWTSDGTAEGTRMVKDIRPGPDSSYPQNLIEVNGVLFFTADDGVNGRELWKSDGTEAGTSLVLNIGPGSDGSNPSSFVAHNNILYFAANDGTNGTELWKTNGDAAGTQLVKDIHPGSGDGSPIELVSTGSTIFFFADDGSNGVNLWKSDGSTAGTSLVKVIGLTNNNDPGELTAVGNIVYFHADDGIHGTELWKSDGTEAGTVLVKDFTPGPDSEAGYAMKHLDYFRAVGDKLYFITHDNGTRLGVTDGTEAGTILLTSQWEYNFSWLDPVVTELNGLAYFITYHDGQQGTGLCVSDGTVEGTSIVKRYVGDALYTYPMMLQANDQLLFFGRGNLWRSDGTEAGTVAITEWAEPRSGTPVHLTDVNGTLYYGAMGNPRLFRSIGASGYSLHVSTVAARELKNINGQLWFSGGAQGHQIWKSDGSSAGTTMVKDLSYDFNGHSASGFSETQNGIVFSINTTPYGTELWRTDGTPFATTLVADINPGSAGSNVRDLNTLGNNAFFCADDGTHGEELWKSSGTAKNTMMVLDINPGPAASQIRDLVNYKGNLYFLATDGTNGFELWRSNGKASGTRMVLDLRTNDNDTLTDLSNLIADDNALSFMSLKDNDKVSLFRSTGTSYGTKAVREFQTSHPGFMLGSIDGIVYFVVQFDDRYELWKSAGKASNTSMIADLGQNKPILEAKVAVLDGAIYFGSLDEDGTYRIWQSDGTSAGTFAHLLEGEPREITASGPYVYFSGFEYWAGRELFAIGEEIEEIETFMASARTGVTEVVEEKQQRVSSYPNPFRDRFTLRVDGEQGETFRMSVSDNGAKALIGDVTLACNEDHTFGENWPSGLYIIRIVTAKKVFAEKVIKIN